jgi:Predicted hydrolases or acyltransferases (alpha/beta hydrolase superfamily)
MPFVTSGTRRIHFEVHGDEKREPLLCMGGWGLLTGDYFTNLPAQWRDRYRFIVFDYRGLGDSDADGEGISTGNLADDAVEVLAAAGVARTHVIGQGGLGAGVAQFLAARHQEKVQSLVLTSGWAGPEPFHDAQLRALYRVRKEFGFDAFRELCLTYTLPPHVLNSNPGFIPKSWAGPANIESRDQVHLDLIDTNLRHDARAELGDVTAPTLVVCGEDDTMGGPRLAEELADLVPNATLSILPRTPHIFAAVEGGIERYQSIVTDFLQSHSR